MDQMIFLYVAVAAFVILFLILFYMNYVKLYTFNDLESLDTSRQRGGFIPTPYQLVYQSHDGLIWTFIMHEDFFKDWKKKRIASVLMGGTLYKIVDLESKAPNTMVMTTMASASQTSFAGAAAADAAAGIQKGSAMFVLGYEMP